MFLCRTIFKMHTCKLTKVIVVFFTEWYLLRSICRNKLMLVNFLACYDYTGYKYVNYYLQIYATAYRKTWYSEHAYNDLTFTAKWFPFPVTLLKTWRIWQIMLITKQNCPSLLLCYKRVLLYMLVNQGFQCKVIHYKANKINVLFLRHCCIRPNATTLINFCW